MAFAEKLDFLMNITKVSNSALAHGVSLDASYISRLRNGKRQMPRDEGVIRKMAVFLARRVSEDYQKKALSDTLKLAGDPRDGALLSDEVARWLLNERLGISERVSMFLEGLSDIASRPMPFRQTELSHPSVPADLVTIHYGVEGKRRAVEYFLSVVALQEKPQTLLLFSDEETSWMTGDPVFVRRWAELMVRVLSKGNRIKIVHTINRDLDEMLSAITQWMPLYMTGAIEPYFCPKKRDGIFKRTLFIAPETAAVVSSSVGAQLSVAANILCRDITAVSSFAEEFLQYLRLCRPLMRIFTARDREACFSTLIEFENERADSLMKTESLSLLTMPEDLFVSVFKRADADLASIMPVYEARRKSFIENLRQNRFTEIISLPDINAVKNGAVKISMSDLLGGGAMYYTREEFSKHLMHIIHLLRSCENYRAFLTDRPGEDRYMVYAREELGAIVAKTSKPPLVLAVSEGNMTSAFWDFLKGIVGEKAYDSQDNSESVAYLLDYVEDLNS